jgi:uncharacterized damage-inducible protein DinB
MATEGAAIAGQIERQLRKIQDELAGLSDEALNRELEIQPTNTLFQLGTHVAGSARYWAITCAGGTDFVRHRASEFAASGRGADIRADLDLLVTQIHESLDALGGSDLDRPTTGDPKFRTTGGSDDPLPLRDAVLHALEHTALHRGHIQITRQLLGFDPVTDA